MLYDDKKLVGYVIKILKEYEYDRNLERALRCLRLKECHLAKKQYTIVEKALYNKRR